MKQKHPVRLSVILWASLLLGGPVALAAEPAADDQEEAPEVEPPAGTGTSTDGDAASAPEVFVPSEEISEDFAVSFPVDI